MKIFFLVAFSFSVLNVFSQESSLKKLEELQRSLDEINHRLGRDTVVEVRKIHNQIDNYEIVKRQRDSLLILTELLKAENLLLQSKLSAYTHLSSGAVVKGIYVVLRSSRDKLEMQNVYADLKKTYPDYDVMIIQNDTQTWFHTCLVQNFNSGTSAGKKVEEMRSKGFSDAWWINLD